MNSKKEYKKIIKKYRKTFKKLAKEVHPFDARFGLNMFVEHLKFMREYYQNGYNVMAQELEGHLTRFEGIDKAIRLYELGWDPYLKYEMEQKYFEMEDIAAFTGEVFSHPNYQKPLNGLTSKEAFEKIREDLHEVQKQFYELLLEELDDWWD